LSTGGGQRIEDLPGMGAFRVLLPQEILRAITAEK
jgi:hypothetical protein